MAITTIGGASSAQEHLSLVLQNEDTPQILEITTGGGLYTRVFKRYVMLHKPPGPSFVQTILQNVAESSKY